MSVYKISGVAGEIEIFDDKLSITPRGVLGLLNKGLKGTKTIPFSSITGIQHKKAGLTSGYLQFTLPGGNESRGGVFAEASDENTFMFTTKMNDVVQQAKEFIERKVHEAKSPRPAVNGTSTADELMKLAGLKQQGVLSEQEFERAKAKLLGA